VLRITDPAEVELPDVGLVRVVDPETNEQAVIDTSSRAVRHRWLQERARHDTFLKNLTARCGVDLVELRTDRDVVEPLSRLFLQRRKRINV
jgi:uncharacterized protein (DUF58 family)